MAAPTHSPDDVDLIEALDSLDGLLNDPVEPDAAPADDTDDEIPLLDEVVLHPDDLAGEAHHLKAAMEQAPPPEPAPAIDVESAVEALLDARLAALRDELKAELLAELKHR